jgi:hypothetical protein
MPNKNSLRFAFAFSLLVLTLSPSSFANLLNGDFSTSNLTGWTVEYGDVSDGGGYALFQEHPTDISSTLSQMFTIPTTAPGLWFDVSMSAVPGGAFDPFAPPDAFTVSLLDPITYTPLISTPGFPDFYYQDNTGFIDTVALVSGNTVNLDISSVWGKDVLLSFDLWGADDGMLTTVSLDNVYVPLPSALLLGITGMGTGMVGLWRRSRKSG